MRFRTDRRDGWTLVAAARQRGLDARFVITTNTTRRRDGNAIMGAGLALQAKQRYEQLELFYGLALAIGQEVFEYRDLVLLPTKDNWRKPSSLARIERSLFALLSLDDHLARSAPYYIVPRLGCANGGLRWSDVRPHVEAILAPIGERVIFSEP